MVVSLFLMILLTPSPGVNSPSVICTHAYHRNAMSYVEGLSSKARHINSLWLSNSKPKILVKVTMAVGPTFECLPSSILNPVCTSKSPEKIWNMFHVSKSGEQCNKLLNNYLNTDQIMSEFISSTPHSTSPHTNYFEANYRHIKCHFICKYFRT